MDVRSESMVKRYGLLAPTIIRALESRKFGAYYCPTAEEALQKALSLIPAGASVSWGGSVTLREIGLLDCVREGGYRVVDRDAAKSQEERMELMRRAFLCDVYLTSVNALSEDGVLVDVDGMGNRAAATLFGPKSVIAVVGMNKICRTEEDAVTRARTEAAPVNAARLGLAKTPCSRTGACGDCKTDECICSDIVKIRMSLVNRRIQVILVGEPLGF